MEQKEGYQDEIHLEISRSPLSLKMCGGEILASNMQREFFFHSYVQSDLLNALFIL